MIDRLMAWLQAKRPVLLAAFGVVFVAWLCMVFEVDRRILEKPQRIISLPFDNCGEQLVVTGEKIVVFDRNGGRFHVFDEPSGRPLYTLPAGFGVLASDGLFLCRIDDDPDGLAIRVHRLATGELLRTIRLPETTERITALSMRNGIVAAGDDVDRRAYVYDAATGRMILDLPWSGLKAPQWVERTLFVPESDGVQQFVDPATSQTRIVKNSLHLDRERVWPGDDCIVFSDRWDNVCAYRPDDPVHPVLEMILPPPAWTRPSYYATMRLAQTVDTWPYDTTGNAICGGGRLVVMRITSYEVQRRRFYVCDAWTGQPLGSLAPRLPATALTIDRGRLYIAGLPGDGGSCQVWVYDLERLYRGIASWPAGVLWREVAAWLLVLLALALILPPPVPVPGTELLWRLLLPRSAAQTSMRIAMLLALVTLGWLASLPIAFIQPGRGQGLLPRTGGLVMNSFWLMYACTCIALLRSSFTFRKRLREPGMATSLLVLPIDSPTYTRTFTKHHVWVQAQMMLPLVSAIVFLDAADSTIARLADSGILAAIVYPAAACAGTIMSCVWTAFWLSMYPGSRFKLLGACLSALVYLAAVVAGWQHWGPWKNNTEAIPVESLFLLVIVPAVGLGAWAWDACRHSYVEGLRRRLFD